MWGSNSCFYGMKYRARCLSALWGERDPDVHRFLAATTQIREENEIHLLDFNEDANEVSCVKVYNHAEEVWGLAPSPCDPSLFFTCYNTGTGYGASLWRAPDLVPGSQDEVAAAGSGGGGSLDRLWTLPDADEAVVRGIVWEPSDDGEDGGKRVVSVHDSSLRLWDIEYSASGSGGGKAAGDAPAGELCRLSAGAWDPHHRHEVATVDGGNVKGWDLRSMKQTHSIPNAHTQKIRDIDYNPNRTYVVVTAGDDCRIRFWDLRKGGDRPLQSLAGHTHWVWNAKFNPSHDQLLLSCGSDNVVNLWRVSSISSAPLLEVETKNGQTDSEGTGDSLVKSFDAHEDSVYAISWSASDAWIFASLSYDGRVAVNRVPPSEKYKILL